ncbi:MAG: hypothetical protein H0U73_05315 [Tatlockia sp.]|nr:hypothetical protein [Tatlockia sp.]
MIKNKRLCTLSLISLATVFLYQPNAMAGETAQKATILFFQHANQGTISQEKTNTSCYHIQLSQLKDQMIYFANEPARTTGVMNWADFALTWAHNDIHPNAVIHAMQDKKPINDTVTLSNLQYDKINNTAAYKACALDPKSKFVIGQLADVSVFIDPFHPWP